MARRLDEFGVDYIEVVVRGMQDVFADSDGVVMIGDRDEAAVRASYSRHLPMSTSILAFHKLAEGPALILERHGSLAADDIREIVAAHGFGLALADTAGERLPLRVDTTVSV